MRRLAGPRNALRRTCICQDADWLSCPYCVCARIDRPAGRLVNRPAGRSAGRPEGFKFTPVPAWASNPLEPFYGLAALILAAFWSALWMPSVAVAIAEGSIRFARDHVLGEMVRGLGLGVVEVDAPFEPECGAYGGHAGHGSHGHSADGEGRGPRPDFVPGQPHAKVVPASVRFGKRLAGVGGLEPTTLGFGDRCSTN